MSSRAKCRNPDQQNLLQSLFIQHVPAFNPDICLIAWKWGEHGPTTAAHQRYKVAETYCSFKLRDRLALLRQVFDEEVGSARRDSFLFLSPGVSTKLHP
jgi:hypothetical protein